MEDICTLVLCTVIMRKTRTSFGVVLQLNFLSVSYVKTNNYNANDLLIEYICPIAEIA